ncbi:MAG: peptidoglycan DD-metalloendopeptidase family protein [Bacteroidales bacterium]|nr:peptidoglycan DD-metalloendopeptidase family protein [Bacteroidales bacterium]
MRRLLIIIMAFALTLPVQAQKSSSMKKLESQRAQLEKEIAILNRQLKENSSAREKELTNLTLVRSKIQAREKLIAASDQTLRILDDSIRTCRKDIEKLQARHDTLSAYYARLVRSTYKNRDSRMWYMYVLASESIGQGFRRFGYLRSLASEMGAQATRIRETSAALEVEKERLEGLRAAEAATRKQIASERTKLRGEEDESNRLVQKLGSDRKKYQQQLQSKNRQKEDLNRKIADLIRKESQKKGGGSTGKSGKKTSTAIDTKLSNEFASNKGRLPWPVEGAIVERFGKHKHPVYQNVDLPQNNGVTLAVKRGTQAKAVFNGTVTQIVVLPGYNQCVLVNHGAYYTLYSKLATVAVKPGDKVKTGQVVGIVDTIGGEDLFHFELWQETTPQNPENWLRD